MKVLGSIGLAALLAVFATGPAFAAQSPVGLGTADAYAVLAGSAITNTGKTTITGDVGLAPGTAVTGFNSVTLHGTQHVADAAARSAKNALVTAYNDAAGRTPKTTVGTELGGQSLTAGVYATADGTLGLTGTVTLNGQGDPNAVFIFEAASTLTTASGSKVTLANSTQACNVFWRIGSSATLGTSTSFQGNILALTSITMTTGATLVGSALARNGAVTLDTNVITRAVCSNALASASASAAASGRASASAGATTTPPPTSTSGSQGSGSGSSILLLFAGLAAAAAFVTIRRMDPIRRNRI
jgi:hypothetical protein